MENKFEEYEKIRSYLDNPFYMSEIEMLFGRLESEELNNYYKQILTDDNNSTPWRIYPFTNEKLSGLFKKIDFKDKKVLTVGSSSDQALWAVLNGAKEITNADLNIYTKPFGEFKIAAKKALSKKEFLEYIYCLAKIPRAFLEDKKTYSRVSKYLTGKSKIFWDTIMFEKNQEVLSLLFHYCNFNNALIDLDYDKLQDKLLKNDYKINYVFANYQEFPDVLNEKYDIILLSNIKDYFEKNSLMNVDMETIFYKVLIKLYRNNLNKNGLIQLNSWKTFDESNSLNLPEDFKNNLVNVDNQPFLAKGKYKKLLKKEPELENELE